MTQDDPLHRAFEDFARDAGIDEGDNMADNTPQIPDSILTSAWRGRVLAVISGGIAAWTAGVALIDHLRTGGEIGAATVEHVGGLLTATDALLVAVAGLAAMTAAAISKWREWRANHTG